MTRAALLAIAFSFCHAAEADLIPNGGFEAASEKDPTLPRAWTPHVGGKVTCAWAVEGARSGTRCLEMAAEPGEKWGHAYWTSDPVAVKPCMAYRVTFHFKSKGWGVPCFSLAKVKEWRLFKGDTEGKWLAHDDVVVIPPGVTETSFSVNNYHRPGKTMWLDDVSLVELPLADSPLARRLATAKTSVAALDRNLATVRLTLEQEEQRIALRDRLAEANAAFEKLRGGEARPNDFKQMSDALDAVEKAVGGWLFTVWAVAPDDWERGATRPVAATRQVKLELLTPGSGTARQLIGLMSLVHEGLPMRVSLVADRGAKDAEARLLVTPANRLWAGSGLAWGELGPLGEVLLPPGVPRFLQLQLTPGKARPGVYTFRLTVEGLDRTAEPGEIAVQVRIP
ncbi:MAG TPA: hypothetical protein VNE39_09115 [Planctomycetota bacterium]|nr:hypothetical protein [Planctomycetota bacterium]